ncbi:hypothetical protein E2C01_044714 [Portunus trituberculatus]|uniref:Uncharacterized protein n=1 Tax=Portunus trituberculatus TaxID=210409 RepID=A0A5B7FTU8_PORTR|nr:hypothetical protein [Portunus trituberculatus]
MVVVLVWHGRFGGVLVIIVRGKYGNGDRGCTVICGDGVPCMNGRWGNIWATAVAVAVAAGVAAVPLQVATMNTSSGP